MNHNVLIKALMLAIPQVAAVNETEAQIMRVELRLLNYEKKYLTGAKRQLIKIDNKEFLVYTSNIDDSVVVERIEHLEGGELSDAEMADYYDRISIEVKES